MGTSVSQSSPRKSSSWKRVFVCYENNFLPQNRVISEIWRALETLETGSVPLSSEIKSPIIYSCYEAVKSSKSFEEAIHKVNNQIVETKSNSIVAEFAKRVIPPSYQSKTPSQQWAVNFFKEITKYVISRDISGFVGGNYRNKSVKELIDFKNDINNNVDKIVSSPKKDFKSLSEWNSFVDSTILKLKSSK